MSASAKVWRGREPGLHGFERGRVDAVAGRDRVDAQPLDQLRRADAALGQREPVEQHARDRVRLRRRQPRDAIGNAARVVRRRGAEHGVDQGPGRREIRDGDQHVGGREAGIGVEPREQPVVQHFELAREAVAHVHLDARLGGRRPQLRLGLQREHRVLDPREPGRRGIVDVQRRIARRRALGQLVQHVQLRLGLPAPLGEERMADLLVVELVGRIERFRARGRDDVEPEFAARIERVDPHVDPARQLAQQRHVQRRHGRQREHADRRRPARRKRGRIERLHLVEEAVRGRHAAVAQLGEQRAPQRALPRLVVARGVCAVARRALAFEDRAAVAPQREPLRPIREVMVEHHRDALRQLVTHRRIGRREVGGQPRRRAPRRVGLVRQQPVTAPHEPVGRIRRTRRHGQHLADLCPQPLREIGELYVRAHAVQAGDVEFEPPAQRRARHDHLLRGPRPAGRRLKIGEQRGGERLVTVRIEKVEHETCAKVSRGRARAVEAPRIANAPDAENRRAPG